MNKSGMKKEDG